MTSDERCLTKRLEQNLELFRQRGAINPNRATYSSIARHRSAAKHSRHPSGLTLAELLALHPGMAQRWLGQAVADGRLVALGAGAALSARIGPAAGGANQRAF